MRIAYVIQGHKNPAQIARLVKRLNSENSPVWWHVSAAKHRLDQQVRLLLDHTPHVHEVPAQYMYWNSWSFVRAILFCLRWIVSSGEHFDYVVLITGQDYPLLSRQQMLDYFQQLDGRSLLDHFEKPLPTPAWSNGGLDRFQNLHFVIPKPWGRGDEYRFEIKPPYQRTLPDGYRLWGGGGYWALTREHVTYLIRTLEMNPRLERLFRFSSVPDEIFFHTLLLSKLPHSEFINQSVTYAAWNRPSGPYPAIFTNEDLYEVISSVHPFARKFDIQIDSRILDLIDERIS